MKNKKRQKSFYNERAVLIDRLQKMQSEIENGGSMKECKAELQEMLSLTTKIEQSYMQEESKQQQQKYLMKESIIQDGDDVFYECRSRQESFIQ